MTDQRKPIQLAADTITAGNFDRLIEWLQTYPRLTKGEQTLLYEQKYAEAAGAKHAVFVNSGSSANLLMIYALVAAGYFAKKRSKKVAVPALCWITDVSPIIQLGLEPVLVDCNLEDLSMDLDHLRQQLEEQTINCVIHVPVLGLVPDMRKLTQICHEYDCKLIIDNCEGFGSRYGSEPSMLNPDGLTYSLEQYGLMASGSSYYGHIISTIEGGMITTDSDEMYELLLMLRSHGWTRDINPKRRAELEQKYQVSEFDSLYTFYQPGFNLRSTDLQAKIGLMQLEKLDFVTQVRFANYHTYQQLIKNDYWKPIDRENCFVSNMGYPVIHPSRDAIVRDLINNQVEVRPLISGSMGKQPFFVERYGRVVLPNAEKVDKYGFYIPNHPYLEKQEIEFICSIINKYTAA